MIVLSEQKVNKGFVSIPTISKVTCVRSRPRLLVENVKFTAGHSPSVLSADACCGWLNFSNLQNDRESLELNAFILFCVSCEMCQGLKLVSRLEINHETVLRTNVISKRLTRKLPLQGRSNCALRSELWRVKNESPSLEILHELVDISVVISPMENLRYIMSFQSVDVKHLAENERLSLGKVGFGPDKKSLFFFLCDIIAGQSAGQSANVECLAENERLSLEKVGLGPDEKSFFCPFSRKLNLRNHRTAMMKQLLRDGDVAENPGPLESTTGSTKTKRPPIQVMSYNVRGLNDEKKLRHLLSHYHKKCSKDVDTIVCLQETFLDKPGKLPYIWRGNYFMTEGNGNSCGCLTLMSSHISVLASRKLEDRGHVIVCAKNDKVTYVVANIYAPNANSSEKKVFFENLFDTIIEFEQTYDCRNLIIAGDFNLVFKKEEAKNRLFTAQEKGVGEVVKAAMAELGLSDCWKRKTCFTWRRPNSDIFSTIDRILFSESLKLLDTKTNWALSYSDHAEVTASFE